MLKTLLCLMISVAAFFGADISSGTKINLEGKHTLYFYSSSSNCRIVDVGNGEERDPVYFGHSLKGESVVTLKEFVGKYLKEKKARKVFTETVGTITNEYYYSPYISVYKSINGRKVNIHVSLNGQKATVGVPMIFGSY